MINEEQYVIACVISLDNELKRMRRWYGHTVVDLVWEAINEAAIDPPIVASYLNDIAFQMPEPPIKRTKAQKDYPGLMIVDRQGLQPLIVMKLRQNPRCSSELARLAKSASLQDVAADAEFLMDRFAKLGEVTWMELEPYIRALKVEAGEVDDPRVLH